MDAVNAFCHSRRQFVSGGLAVAGLLVPSACSRGESRMLRSVDTHPEGYPTVEAVGHMGALLAERSGGRLNLKTFAGGQLGEEKDTLEITIFGGLDINRVNLAPLNSIVPLTQVPSLPFMFRSTAHMRAAMDGAPGQRILEALEPHGLVGLAFYDSGARSFYTTKRLINSPDDLAGLKIRVQNSDLFVAMVEDVGGDATPMAFGEVYQGLLQGVVDGAENNWPSFESTRHFEVAPYYSLTRHVMAPEVLVMSAKRWSKLSKADQDLIRTCAVDSVPVMRTLWDERVERSRSLVVASGVEVAEPDLQAFQQRVQPVWERYLTTPEMRSLADSIQSVGTEK
jgi:tripartite ATP-independent transporter DctP family solute receptor